MNRLTTRYKPYAPFEWDGGTFLKGAESICPKSFCKNSKKCERNTDRTCPILAALDRLADYEDTGLMPNEIKQQPATNWTPCSEGLPTPDAEENGARKRYLCTTSTPSGKLVVVELIYITVGGKPVWYDNDYYDLFEGSGYQIIAWIPRPTPYNPDHIPDATKKVDQFREPTQMMEGAPTAHDKKAPPAKWCCGKPPIARYTESEIGLSRAFHTIKCQVCHSGVQVDIENDTEEAYDAAFKHAVELWNDKVQHRPLMNSEICIPRTEATE